MMPEVGLGQRSAERVLVKIQGLRDARGAVRGGEVLDFMDSPVGVLARKIPRGIHAAVIPADEVL